METETNGTNGKSTALAIRTPVAVNAYEPRSSTEAIEIAKHFASSKLLPDLNADAVFLIMAVGAELGIPATAALRSVYVVKGKPFVSADLMKSLCLRRRDVCEFFRLVKSDATLATYTAKRVGDEAVTMTFTIEQAKRAKLIKGDSAWEAYPETMLRHRCVAMLAREVFPDLTLGIYCQEEREEMEAIDSAIDAEVVEAKAADDFAERIEAFFAQLAAAQTADDLKAFRSAVSKDPAAAEVKERVKDAYDAKAAEIKAKE